MYTSIHLSRSVDDIYTSETFAIQSHESFVPFVIEPKKSHSSYPSIDVHQRYELTHNKTLHTRDWMVPRTPPGKKVTTVKNAAEAKSKTPNRCPSKFVTISIGVLVVSKVFTYLN